MNCRDANWHPTCIECANGRYEQCMYEQTSLLRRIQQAQVEAGERVVMDHLSEQGLPIGKAIKREKPFVIVPVLASFASNEIIGDLRIFRSSLPLLPNFHFALRYIALEKTAQGDVTRYELNGVAIVEDKDHAR